MNVPFSFSGSLTDWDGLVKLFEEIVDSDRSALEDGYLKRWHRAAIRAGASPNKPLQQTGPACQLFET
jgi:hypothetical protein